MSTEILITALTPQTTIPDTALFQIYFVSGSTSTVYSINGANLKAVLRSAVNLAASGTGGVTGTLTVASGGTGATTVAGALIALTPASVTISASAIDWSAGTSFYKTLGADTTFTFSNITDGQTIIVALTNTSGNYVATWPTVNWAGGSAPVQTVGAHTDVYTFVRINGVTYGNAVQNF